MKQFKMLLGMLLLMLFSCSQSIDDAWELEEQQPNVPEKHPVSVNFSQASLELFSEQGITEVGIYVYLKDSLVYGKNLPLGNGNLKIELPLGENLQTFAVANADHLVGADSLSKAIVYQDIYAQKEVYISGITNFSSDKSVPNLSLELKRVVGQAVFKPKETDEKLDAITQFDQLNITFTNVGVAYKVKTGECIQQDVTISTKHANRFGATVYSFPTIKADSRTLIDVVYLKGGTEVNRVNSPLDTSIAFEPSKRSTVNMAILDEAYLQNSLKSYSVTTNFLKPFFTLKETEF